MTANYHPSIQDYLNRFNQTGRKTLYRLVGSCPVHWKTPVPKFTPLVGISYIMDIPDLITEMKADSVFYTFEYDAENVRKFNNGKDYDTSV